MKAKRFRVSMAFGAVALLVASLSAGSTANAADCSLGCWSKPFSPAGQWDAAPPATPADSVAATPAAASAVVLPNGQILYWNGLQNLENCTSAGGLPTDAGACARNSKSEILDLTGTGNVDDHFYPVATNGGDDLFCSDQRLLADGRVISAGGTHWEQEIDLRPTTGGQGPSGLAELYGSKNTHVFGEAGWGQVSDMAYGRWYPSMLTMPNGKLFVAGGTAKLLWNSSLLDARASQPYPVNVVQTETLDPSTGSWTYNGTSADITLPQFARIHELPNGDIFYTGAGQMWGPGGESVDELEWNFQKIYDPKTNTWTRAGIGSFGARGGTFSAALPLVPDKNGNYNRARFLLGGGVLGTDPGLLLGTDLSEIVTVAPDSTGKWGAGSVRTGNMANRRWYSSAVVLPNGQVLAFSGANIDEVNTPGLETAVRQAELFDPATDTWTGLTSSGRDRTYHNSALLLADGSVLVGGHAPINQLYNGTGAVDNQALFSNNLKDPSFERFYPPYLSAGARPQIATSHKGVTWGDTDAEIATIVPGSEHVAKLELVRLPSVTHTTDADNRTVVLKFHQVGKSLHADKIPDANVLPPGYYYLFGLSKAGVPSIATIVKVSADGSSIPGTATPVQLIDTPLR